MNPLLQRGLLLYDQHRFEQAEVELRQALAEEPQDALIHAVLSLCLARRSNLVEADAEARQAVHLAPDLPLAHHALASVLHDRRRLPAALTAIREAIRLDPDDVDHHALEAQIHLDARQWTDALDAAERGLRLDGEHVLSTNLRAIALVKLGRKAEASASIDAALRRDPDNAVTHANQGWAYLEQSNPKKALVHFRESLRLDPTNAWARAGLVEALKARNIVYGLLLRYFLWMAKLPFRARLGIVVGGYLLSRMLASAAEGNPRLAPWILPFQIIYLTLALLTWTADPLFNLLLRLSPYGRLALTEEQTRASTWFGATVIPALLSLALCCVFGFRSIFILCALVFGFLMVTVSGSFKASPGWPRTLLIVCTIALAVAGLGALALLVSGIETGGDAGKRLVGFSRTLLGLFVAGCVIFMWAANVVISIRPKR